MNSIVRTRAAIRVTLIIRTAQVLLFVAILSSTTRLAAQDANSNGREPPQAGVQLTHSSESCAETIAYDRGLLAAKPADLKIELGLARSLVACRRYSEAVPVYRHLVDANPEGEYVVRETGEALSRAGRSAEAIPVFRQALALNSGDSEARLGLAQALGARGSYAEALERYDEVLAASPDDYDALEGKAMVLYWSNHFAQARAILDKLQHDNSADPEVRRALEQVSQAHETAYWTAERPPAQAKPEEYLNYYEKRLATYPKDHDALKAVAYYKAELGDHEGAIGGYQQLLAAYPDDHDAKVDLARLLGQRQDYTTAITLDQELLAAQPRDVETMESLARLYTWSGQLSEALAMYRTLAAEQPTSHDYRLEEARLEFEMKDYGGARSAAAELISAEPQNRGARLLLAQVNLKEGHLASALRQFNETLKQDPKDHEALYGKAQIEYYQGDVRDAQPLAERLVQEYPQDFDAVVLLANIERVRHQRQSAVALLDHAARLSPRNPEVNDLREKVEWPSTLHMTASYAREIGQPGTAVAGQGSREDLRTFGYGTTLETAFLPRSDSSLAISYLPSNSPLGALQGAVAPAQFIYQQASEISSRLTLRGGIGLVRFGPATLNDIPGRLLPVTGFGVSPIGFIGASLLAQKRTRFNFTWSRSAIPYTPLTVRLGVIESRFEGNLSLFPTPSTELDLSGFGGRFDSEPYDHVSFAHPQTRTGPIVQNKIDRDRELGASAIFDWHAVRRAHSGFDVGYSGLAYGYHGQPKAYMGFFDPGFYQRHLATTRFYTKLSARLGFEVSDAIGVQQVEHGQAYTRGLMLNPAFTIEATPRLSFKLGYIHYNYAETLGVLSGNGVQLSTDIKF
jgi:tetratricopeptide (TPR) repeat protein